jgi:hypothetical protein
MPPGSPDQTPMFFYFWGVVKEKAYSEKSRTLHNLKSATEDAFAETDKDPQL